MFTQAICAIPVLQRMARQLCDTPQKQTRMSFAMLSLQVSRRYAKYRCWASKGQRRFRTRKCHNNLYSVTLIGVSLDSWETLSTSINFTCLVPFGLCCPGCPYFSLCRRGHLYSQPLKSLDLRVQSPYTGVSTPASPKIPKKSQKGLPGPPRPECQKSVEKVPEH